MDEAELVRIIDDRIYRALAERTYLNNPAPILSESAPFMEHGTVAASDFTHPRYFSLCKLMGASPVWHRKQWEWVFAAHHLTNFIRPGMRGVGFGCGTEPLPALWASLGAEVVATDAPDDQGKWSLGNQWSDRVERLQAPNIIANEILHERVSFRPCDMTDIPEDLVDFDFTWSSCAFEHLGSIEAGQKFVMDSLRTLRPGGVAVHTTEFNLSSDDDTLTEGDTILYRRRDIVGLIDWLRAEGHHVADFTISPTAHHFDTIIDVPPWTARPHLKAKIASFVTTSAGIVVTRGG